MKALSYLFFILSISIGYSQSSDSTLAEKCGQDKFSCGECETNIQTEFNKLLDSITVNKIPQLDHWGSLDKNNQKILKMDQSVSQNDVLKKIITLLKNNNTDGDNKLNYVLIGESESLQETTIRDGKLFPRIMLKSPSSELLVTFNTDPKADGYDTIEVMRWNGKEGRYQFQELNFSQNNKHVDVSGKKCMECHKNPSPRPNWDTYRAWAGVVPSRDDMLEVKTKDEKLDVDSGLQPDARAYLNFLEQIVEAKSSSKGDERLKLLEIPFDEKVQLKDMVDEKRSYSPKEKVELIKRNLNEKGFYRIKHFPDKSVMRDSDVLSNMDGKTAEYAGPSQFAFDQMLAQNMCRVATDLSKHENYDHFKYALAGVATCGVDSISSLLDYLPSSYIKKIKNYYQKNIDSSLKELTNNEKNKIYDIDIEELFELILSDTKRSHSKADGFKFKRHGRFLNKYLTRVDKLDSKSASEKAKFYSEKIVTPYQDDFHAIDDEGGVKGVEEGAADEIATLRILLEPLGVKVEHWSMVNGKDNSYHSFSFSDQFGLLMSQKLFYDLKKEVNPNSSNSACNTFEKKSVESLQKLEADTSSIKEIPFLTLGEICYENKSFFNMTDFAKPFIDGYLAIFADEAHNLLSKCMSCHDQEGYIPFEGLSDFVKNSDDPKAKEKFIKFLNTNSVYQIKYIELFNYKLGVRKSKDFGSDMPPTEWKDNHYYALRNKVDVLHVQNIRRKFLADYLSILNFHHASEQTKKELCRELDQSNFRVKDLFENRSNIKNKIEKVFSH